MGASSHERVVSLWREGTTISKPTGRRIRDPYGYGFRDEYVTTTGRRKRITPREAWDAVHSQEGYEDGHSYSGTFGSKDGMVVLAVNPKLDPLLGELGTVIQHLTYDGEDAGDWNPLKVSRRPVHCTRCHGSGSVLTKPMDWDSERLVCPDCGGKGTRPRNAEERAAERKKINARKRLIALLGEQTMKRIAEVYDDKWGPAAAVVGKDKVWFGGMCSS